MELQLEISTEKQVEPETELSLLQKQFVELTDSMGKVRRKLFGELGEMKKVFETMKKENEDLKSMLKESHHGKAPWPNTEGCSIFDVSKHQEIAS